MFGPVGEARATDGGYRFSGSYRFGSGCGHASWIAAGAMEKKDGEVVTTDVGLPSLLVGFLRPEQVDMRGNWDVMGLAGTGSYDYVVEDELVDAGFTFRLLEAAPRRGGPMYQIGLFGLVASGHAGFALGVGKRALVEVLAIAESKVRMGSFESVTAQQMFQHEFAMHDAAMRAASAYVYESFGAAEAVVLAGLPCSVRAAAADASGHDIRDAHRSRRGALRVHLGRHGCAAQPERPSALLSRHPCGYAAHLRRQQHAHGLHADAPGNSHRRAE